MVMRMPVVNGIVTGTIFHCHARHTIMMVVGEYRHQHH